jgi:hypothetical protein
MSQSKNDQIATNDFNATNSTVQTQSRESSKVPNEILDYIFAQVPVKQRARLRIVSKGRRNFIDKANLVDPAFVRNTNLYYGNQVPCYPAYIDIRLNPILDIERHLATGVPLSPFELDLEYPKYPWCRLRCVGDETAPLQHKNDFITSPPITVIAIAYSVESITSILRVADGIRGRHFLDICTRMHTQAAQIGWSPVTGRREPFKWTIGHFLMCMSEAVEAKLLEDASATSIHYERADQVEKNRGHWGELVRKTGTRI